MVISITVAHYDSFFCSVLYFKIENMQKKGVITVYNYGS